MKPQPHPADHGHLFWKAMNHGMRDYIYVPRQVVHRKRLGLTR